MTPDTVLQAKPTEKLPPIDLRPQPTTKLDTKASVRGMFDKLEASKGITPASAATDPAPAAIAPIEPPPAVPVVPVESPKPTEAPPVAPILPPADDDEPGETEAKPVDMSEATKRLNDPHVSRTEKKLLRRFFKAQEKYETDRKTWESQQAALQTERDEALKKVTVPEDYEPTKAEKERLAQENRKYQRRFGLVDDATFNKPFDEKRQLAETSIKQALLRNAIPEKATTNESGEEAISMEFINKAGGFAQFAEKYPHAYTDLLTYLDKRDPRSATIVRMNVADIDRVAIEKQSAIDRETQEADKWFSERETQGKQAQVQTAAQIKANADALVSHRTAVFNTVEDFKVVPIAPSEKPEVAATLKARNAQAESNRKALEEVHAGLFEGKATPQQLAAAAIELVQGRARVARIAELEKQVATLEAADKARKEATRPPQGRVSASNGAAPSANNGKPKTFREVADEAQAARLAKQAALMR